MRGDLARLTYFIGLKDYRTNSSDLPLKHIEMKDFQGQHIDVLTIGDSFSQGGGGGKNRFYQDYIASFNNLSVLNVYAYPTEDLVAFFSPLSTLKVLYNSGYLDIIKPRIILIESIERYCIRRYARPYYKGMTVSLDEVRTYYRTKTFNINYLPKRTFINEGNFKYVYYNMMYRLSLNPLKGGIITAQLDRPLFSGKNSSKLIFYKEDVDNFKDCNIPSMILLNDNFNVMARLLKKKGIRLYFMPIVDKYDLYSEHIVDNPYPRSVFFETLRGLPKEYNFIDTKKILSEVLNHGEKDIYYVDDTHWSWKATRSIFEQVKFK